MHRTDAQREGKRVGDHVSENTKPSKLSRSFSQAEAKEKPGSDLPRRGEEEEEEEEEKPVRVEPNPRMQRYLVAVEYIGTRFSGSQKQPNCRTVVGTLEEAFCKFVGQPVSIYCSSRTDAGVHALSNVCHVDVERISKRKPGEVLPPHEPGVVRRAVNHFLQIEGDIMVTDVRCIPSDFHARYKAVERIYFYRLLSGPEPLSTFERERAWHVPEKLDVDAMKNACKILVGHHDFSSFRAAGCQANSPIRTLDELHVTEVASFLNFSSTSERRGIVCDEPAWCSNMLESESSTQCSHVSSTSIGKCSANSDIGFGMRTGHRCYVITARARSFLYHQVRLLVGVLKCAGTGELTFNDVERILNAKTVTAASPMAPACGLYLGNVKYELP
ncbi:tRNA pseudouridine synthase A isoform X2 [Dioscorea cayenensis subsp. rotundata]|uniref:tRNA pseudouridine synthase n=1 Tax=Dioscorea cayennensis subsp. rotundata TaxID=55577 RepID=A0AB40CET5_DIOCR|nr:tRNA pseudouridine synthase A isoform X2 [Dioscorea cayenensis subsp. rotundata]